MIIVYFYKSIDGKLVPDIFEGAIENLHAQFEGSATPIVKAFVIGNSKRRRKHWLRFFERKLTNTPRRDIGIRFNIERILKELG